MSFKRCDSAPQLVPSPPMRQLLPRESPTGAYHVFQPHREK